MQSLYSRLNIIRRKVINMNFTETNALESEIIIEDTHEKYLPMKDILVTQLIEF